MRRPTPLKFLKSWSMTSRGPVLKQAPQLLNLSVKGTRVGGFGITVNAIAPGFIATEMTAALPKKVHTDIVSTIALGRIGAPQDVAKVALFLASPLADYVSGQTLGVDGCQIL